MAARKTVSSKSPAKKKSPAKNKASKPWKSLYSVKNKRSPKKGK